MRKRKLLNDHFINNISLTQGVGMNASVALSRPHLQ